MEEDYDEEDYDKINKKKQIKTKPRFISSMEAPQY